MATATITNISEVGTQTVVQATVNEGGSYGVVMYTGCVNTADLVGKTTQQKQALFAAAVAATRNITLPGPGQPGFVGTTLTV